MIEQMKKIDDIRNYTKEQLIKKIHEARQDISMIGSIAFDLPWTQLKDEIINKFKNNNFTIHILRESETTIAQYALLTVSQEEEQDYGNLSRGNLIGIKDKVIKNLKDELSKVNNGNNIEPPEDKYAVELGKVYYEVKRKYMLESYSIHGCQDDFYKYLDKCIKSTIEDTKNSFLGNKDFIAKVSENIGKDPEIVSRFAKVVDETLSSAFSEKSYFLKNSNVLESMQISDGNKDLFIRINEKGQSSIFLKLVVEAEEIRIEEEVEFPIEEWIEDFTMDSSMVDVNYRLEADKNQAIKRATEIKKKKLEEYESNSKTRQRLFIKNCYMPIPVPMIKIDNELFITMALTKFDNICKFQYVGNVIYNEKERIFQENESGYRSLWIKEFVNYYQEYFINENGAQKYSTEETAKGNRKEVIDIFDENRNRIGIGPRDAFLANMAIVKSVVWALIFDRKGRILIHKRAKNAKDNQGLWDKSVGGHVSTEDLDTIEAIKREITEELFTIEHEGQGGHDIVQWTITNKNKIIYLGDWKTSRFPDLGALNLSADEYYNFSLNYPDINKRDFRREIVITERVLPNGESVKAKCFVDAYLCIVSEDFEIQNLVNSKFALLTPNELKRCVLRKQIKLNEKREYDAVNGKEEEFLPTSDLAYLVESSIWDDIVTEFARRVRETFQIR